MPEGRFLSKAISQSEHLASVSLEADYLFTRCIPHLDREGRLAGHPQLVKAAACPLRDGLNAERVEALLDELAAAELVRWYEVHGKQVLEFPGFRNHQRGMKLDREAPSRLPGSDHPDAQKMTVLRTNSGPTPDPVSTNEEKASDVLRETNSGLTPDQLRTNSALSRSEVEVEVEVKKQKASLSSKKVSRPVPVDWSPSPSHRKQASELGVDVELEADKMRDWAAANGEKKIDWDAAFRNWLRNATAMSGGKNGHAASPIVNDVLELFQNGGAMLSTADTRPHAFAELAERFPDSWARAGPQFERLRFQSLYQLRDNPKDLRREIELQLNSIRARDR